MFPLDLYAEQYYFGEVNQSSQSFFFSADSLKRLLITKYFILNGSNETWFIVIKLLSEIWQVHFSKNKF